MLRSTFIGSHLCFSHETIRVPPYSKTLILFLMISIPNQSTGYIAKRALESSERTCSARLQTSPKISPCCDSDPGPLRRPPATQSGRGDCRRRAARQRIRIPGRLSRTRGLGAAPGPAPGSGPAATVTLRLGRFIGLGPAVTVTRCRSAGEFLAMPARLSESGSAAAAARAAGGESLARAGDQSRATANGGTAAVRVRLARSGNLKHCQAGTEHEALPGSNS